MGGDWGGVWDLGGLGAVGRLGVGVGGGWVDWSFLVGGRACGLGLGLVWGGTWAKTNMVWIWGGALRGRRLSARVPYRHRKTMKFLTASRCDGIDAQCVFVGPINGVSFMTYVEQFLVPTLRPGDIVILDNLGSHKKVRRFAAPSALPEQDYCSCPALWLGP